MGWGQARWIRRPAVDVALAAAWVPFALVVHSVEADTAALATVIGATFLLSFLHQPLTLPLVYGDPDQYALRPRLFTWSPLVFVVAVLVGLHVSFVSVALVAGAWNAEHTLLQRFGLTRIYGRKAGEESGTLERTMLVSWLVVTAMWIGADPATPARVVRLPIGDVNQSSVALLTDLRPFLVVLLVPAITVALAATVTWLGVERRRARTGTANPAKWLYVGMTAALFAWMVVDPVAGFIAYVGAHSVEYFVIVHHSLGTRYDDGSGGALGAVVRTRQGRRAFFAVYVAALVLVVALLERFGTEQLYGFVVLVLGGLHVFYDGFIWKLRRPRVARGLVTEAVAA